MQITTRFKEISIKKKLYAAFLIIFALTVAVALTGIFALINTRAAFSYFLNYPQARYFHYTDAKYQLMYARHELLYMTIQAGDENLLGARLETALDAIYNFIRDIQLAKDYQSYDSRIDPLIKEANIEKIDFMISGAEIFRDEHLIPFYELMKENEVSNDRIQAEVYRGIAVINPFVEILNEMQDAAEIMMLNTQAESDRLALNLTWLLVGIAVISAVIALLMARFTAEVISGPIVKLVDIANNVAIGKLNVSINTSSHDEIGILSRSFADVVNVINMFVHDLHHIGHAFSIDGYTAVRMNVSKYRGDYAEVADAVNDILEYYVVTKDEILECISNIVDGDYDAPLRQYPGRESRINVSVDILRENIRRMEQIMMQKADAEAANKAKSSFLANMSHEIRTPMNAILGATEILLHNESLPDDISEGLGKIHASCELLLGIINDILDFSKIEAGKMDITPAEYKVASLINDSVHLNMMRVDNKPIEFELVIDENTPANLIGDELRIKQILNNLLSNAFKYTDKGNVTLKVSSEPKNEEYSTLVLSVKDTGHGMTKEQMDKLFGEYSRFHKETRTIEGTGLGLAITRQLVSLMHGDIKVESTPDVGSLFTVYLPQKKVDGSIIGKELADNLQQFRTNYMTHKKRSRITRDPMPYGSVLVVDDVETNLYVAAGLMKLYRLNVETVMSGKETIEKIKEGNVYDVIFMDHMMPEMDGIETVKILRGMRYEKPIVALTANAVAGQSDMFLKNGFDFFISKPIDIRQLNDVLNKLVRDKYPPEVVQAAREQMSELGSSGTDGQPPIEKTMLESFLRDARKTAGFLEMFQNGKIEKNEDILRAFTITIHGIKSALANIGQNALSEKAYALEQAGRQNNLELIDSEVGAFHRELSALLERLEAENDDYGEDSDLDGLREKFLRLRDLCTEYDRKGVLDLIAEIKECSKLTRIILNSISNYVVHSDFERAGREAATYADTFFGR